MHTFKFAVNQGRLLSTLRHPKEKLSNKSRGNEMLINEGLATPLGDKNEIDNFIKMVVDYTDINKIIRVQEESKKITNKNNNDQDESQQLKLL